MKKERIETYNALKGIGAIGILFSHMSYLADATNPFWRCFYQVFMSKGSVCASLFMVLSGFFLDYSWKNLGFRRFLIGKLKRIYPLTFLIFLMALAVDLLLVGNDVVTEGVSTGSGLWIFNIFANILLFKAFIPLEEVFYSFHGPSWYISALMGLYIVAFSFLKGIHRDKSKKWLKLVKGGCLTAYILELVICILVHAYNLPGLWLCYVNPWFRIFGEGFAGILLCEYMDTLQRRIKDINKAERIAALLFIAAFLIRNLHLNISAAWIQIIPMAVVIVVFKSGEGNVSKILKSRPMQFLGAISFELYMTHAFVYEGLPIAAEAVNGGIQALLLEHAGTRFIITFMLSIAVAWITKRLMSWINICFHKSYCVVKAKKCEGGVWTDERN